MGATKNAAYHRWYDLSYMASLTPKVIHGRTYYHARQCQRVDGKPKIVKTLYLGSLDHILQALTQAQQPLRPQTARLASFGDVAALFDQAQKIGLVDLIDAQVPKRGQDSRWASTS